MVERKVVIRIIADDADAVRKLEELRRLKDELSRNPTIRPKVDDTDAAAKIDRLGAKLHELTDRALKIKVNDDEAKLQVDEIKAKLKDIAQNWNARVSLDGFAATSAQLAELKRQLDEIQRKNDIAKLGNSGGGGGGLGGLLGRLFGGGGGGGGSNDGTGGANGETKNLLQTINGLISNIPRVGQALGALGPVSLPALLALAAALAAVVGYVGSILPMLTAAGMGLLSFAALAYPTFKKVIAAISGTKGAMKDLSPAQKQIVEGAKSIMAAWSSMAKQFAPMLTPIMNTLLQIGKKLLPDILPFADRAATAIGGLLKQFDGFASSQGFKSFMSTMLKWSGPAITAIGQGIGNVAGALGQFMKELASPQGLIALKGLFAVIAGSIRGLGVAIQGAMRLTQGLGSAFLQIAKTSVEAAKIAGDAWLTTTAGTLRLMSHIPGLGFLKGWATAVDNWKTHFDSSMTGAINTVNSWKQTWQNAPKVVALQANISNLQSRVATAKSLLNDPNLTKTRRANITANISQAMSQIAAIRVALNALNGANANVYVTTIPVGGGTYIRNSPTNSNGAAPYPGASTGGPRPSSVRGPLIKNPGHMTASHMSAPRSSPSLGGGATVVNVTVNGALDKNAVAKQVQTMLLDLKRNRGGVPLGIG